MTLSRVLIIAGSDSGGGAGIQADIKTVTCLQGYAATAITALTAQNTLGVQGIFDVSPEFIQQQIESVMSDIGADAFKTGMLHRADIIEAVAASLKPFTDRIPLVLDPVMFAKGGAALLEPDALSALKEKLIPLAALLTPNIPEAEYLSGMKVTDLDDMKEAAQTMLELGARAVMVKGGHLPGATVQDVLAYPGTYAVFHQPRIETRHTHGTGCTLASAIATGLAQNMELKDAIVRARAYVHTAIAQAPGIGGGHGPLGHGHTVASFCEPR